MSNSLDKQEACSHAWLVTLVGKTGKLDRAIGRSHGPPDDFAPDFRRKANHTTRFGQDSRTGKENRPDRCCSIGFFVRSHGDGAGVITLKATYS